MRALFIHLTPLALCLSLGASPEVKAPAAPTPSVSTPPAANDMDLTRIEAIPYKPQQRKDPFALPTEAERGSKGDLVDDIGVKGRVVSNGRVLAVASDSRGNIRTLPVGYRLRDGEIIAISDRSVTFHQWEINSTNKSVYRTVVKTFKPEEGKP